MTIITPSKKGHFSNYTEAIRSSNNNTEITECIIPAETNSLRFISQARSICKNEDSFIFLHGEAQWKQSIILKVLFPNISVSILFYYGFLVPNIFRRLARAILAKAMISLGIKIFGLETPPSSLPLYLGNSIREIPDPILTPKSTKKAVARTENSVKFLIAGFLDERKSIAELLVALNKFSELYSMRYMLTLLGCQTQPVESHLIKHGQKNPTKLIIKNYRFEDRELADEVIDCDIVLAVYKSHYGSSSIVLTSIQHQKPVLFIPIGVLKSLANQLEMKHLPQTSDAEVIVKSIISILKDPSPQYSAKKAQCFIKNRTTQKFGEKITSQSPINTII